jgi:hypothetical protein
MIAIFGASAGVAGLVLVFIGMLVTTIASYPGGTSPATLRPFRVGAWAGIGVFCLSLLTAVLSLFWLAFFDAQPLYVGAISAFLGLLVVLPGFAAGVVKATV